MVLLLDFYDTLRRVFFVTKKIVFGLNIELICS